MSILRMREYLMQVYKGDKWKKKVKAMDDGQVVAIYMRLKKAGKIS